MMKIGQTVALNYHPNFIALNQIIREILEYIRNPSGITFKRKIAAESMIFNSPVWGYAKLCIGAVK